MSPRDAVASAFRQYATFRGRARRSEFWWFVLFTVVVGIVTSTLDTALFGTRSDDTGPLNAIASLALLVPTLALGWRRMHDTDRHGAKYLIGLIPVVGWILVIAGVLALVLGLVMNNQRSRTTHVEERRDV